jgi:hypothetical protein
MDGEETGPLILGLAADLERARWWSRQLRADAVRIVGTIAASERRVDVTLHRLARIHPYHGGRPRISPANPGRRAGQPPH